MSHARDKAQAFTKQLVGQMVGDDLLVQEGKEQEREADRNPSKAQEKGQDRGQEKAQEKQRGQRPQRAIARRTIRIRANSVRPFFGACGRADVNLVALTHRRRCGGNSRLERGFLGGVFAVDLAVVQNAPLIAHRHDCVLGKSHDR
jgi:hypothetical protein